MRVIELCTRCGSHLWRIYYLILENDEEREWLAKQNFRNTAEDAYTG